MNRWIQRGFKRSRRRKRGIICIAVALAAILVIVSAIRIISYYEQKERDEKNTEEMRAEVTVTPELAVISTAPAVETGESADDEQETEAEENGRLKKVEYTGVEDDRFITLRKKYSDFIGWLKIDGETDEPVVQRDNEFYLDHDAGGRKNINGALFLDAIVDLKTRPYSLIIYGHNMRSGAKFGNLYRYEEPSFFYSHSLITFDTIYENGIYEAFAAGTFKTDDIDIFFMNTLDVTERKLMIKSLRENAAVDTGADIGAADQLLFLITCVDNDTERRFVAAKRKN